MSFKIERGLFKWDFTDHHAVLGVPVDASPDQIRQQYKQIARRLHPDSCQAQSSAEKELAVQLFSKLVSPAYAVLSKSSPRTEHIVVLGHMGKRMAKEAEKMQITTSVAQQLAQAGGNLDFVYKTSVQKWASKQYESLDSVLDAIAHLSELNMVYLMRKEGKGLVMPVTTVGTKTYGSTQTASKSDVEKKPASGPTTSQIDQSLRRAEEYIAKNNVAKAVLELRDALHMEPNNSKCHSLLGIAYLKQNQATMAKVHINKALELNPKDPIGLQGQQILAKLAQKADAGKTTTSGQSTGGKSTPQRQAQSKPSDKSGGGLFGGLFGGKKK